MSTANDVRPNGATVPVSEEPEAATPARPVGTQVQPSPVFEESTAGVNIDSSKNTAETESITPTERTQIDTESNTIDPYVEQNTAEPDPELVPDLSVS